MKRNHITMLVVILLCALCQGCTKEITDYIPSGNDKNIIQLMSLRDKIPTRAANDNGHTWQVYAEMVDTESWYFTSQVTSDNRIVDGPYYWPGTKPVRFFAFAPYWTYSGEMPAIDDEYPKLTITYEPKGAGNDFTIATPKVWAHSGDSSNMVALEFKHMLSKMIIGIKLSPTLSRQGYSLNDSNRVDTTVAEYTAAMKVYYNKGSIDATSDDPVWTNLEVGLGDTLNRNKRTYLFLPQTFNTSTTDSCMVQILGLKMYRNNIEVFSGDMKPYNIKNDVIANNQFLMGTFYRLTLMINTLSEDSDGNPIFGEEITFGSEVVDWSGTSDSWSIPIE